MKKIIFSLLFFASLSCSQKDSNSPEPIVHYRNPEINLNEISLDRCLNLESYLSGIRSMNPRRGVREVTTHFSVTPIKDQPSRNFILRLAYGTFSAEGVLDHSIKDVSEWVQVQQADCKSVKLLGSSEEETLNIESFDQQSITVKNRWGHQMTYRWISPTQMEIEHVYQNGDFLCNKESGVEIHTKKELDWTTNILEEEGLKVDKIDDTYLSWVSEATSFPKDSLVRLPDPFSTTASDLSISKLKEMMSYPLKEELKNCNP